MYGLINNNYKKKTMDIKQKYLEKKDIDCYVQQWQKEKPSYTDEYVKWLEEQLTLTSVSIRTFSKTTLKDAYIQGYRKRAIMSGLSYDDISERNAISEFENWYENQYGC